ncbi:profilin [Tuber borchii]|uniref:Profilin n=1 Tax=Tuber borchii TaxID=42251 RepID=A0A2T7A0J9_TUBBO|nr:profilin [Tuber borchii]
MSWQSYVDTSLVGSGKLDAAAIFSVDGKSVWASSAGFVIKPEEIETLVRAYEGEKNLTDLASTGFHIGGVKYFTIMSTGRSIYGKQGKAGIVCVKTKQAILVAHYGETVQPGEAATTVEKLADYLIGVGY